MLILFVRFVFFVNIFLYDQVDAHYSNFFRRDYIYNGDFSSFYKLHTISRTWADAKLKCHHEGALLFFPETQAETQYAADYIKEKLTHFAHMWIGVSDILAEGDYETVTGRLGEQVFLDWSTGEPNNNNNDEDCVMMLNTGKMNDTKCETRMPFMCKKTLSSIEWNYDCDMPDTKYVVNKELGKCYKFHLKPMSWTNAQAVCIAEQSYLAVINSQAEANFLVKLTAEAPKEKVTGNYLSGAVHLGFHNQLGDGYVTVYGTPLGESGYVKWGGGQPDNRDTELCGSMFYDGGLNDITCARICFFICEHDIANQNSNVDERHRLRLTTAMRSKDIFRPTDLIHRQAQRGQPATRWADDLSRVAGRRWMQAASNRFSGGPWRRPMSSNGLLVAEMMMG